MNRARSLAVLLACSTLAAAPALPALAAPGGTVEAPSAVETEPTGTKGDTADEPTIWANPYDPAASLVITNEKLVDRMTVFDLDGEPVQHIEDAEGGGYGNSDVRGRYVAVAHDGISTFRVDGSTRPRLVPAQEASGNAETIGEGLCMWDRGRSGPADGLFAINIERATDRVRVHPLTDADKDGDLLVEEPVRDFTLSSEAEGCEVDDASGTLWIAEEEIGIWRFDLAGAEGERPPGEVIAKVSDAMPHDVEGLALADGVLYASAQHADDPKDNWVVRFDATDGRLIGTSRVVDGEGSDDCDQTDGIDAYAGPLGPRFPHGLFVCQDGFNDAPGTSGTQNFKFAPLELLGGDPGHGGPDDGGEPGQGEHPGHGGRPGHGGHPGTDPVAWDPDGTTPVLCIVIWWRQLG